MKQLVIVVLISAFLFPYSASAHNRTGAHNVYHAINFYWCGNSKLKCYAGEQAKQVARCESGWRTHAQNGQYLGIFQMGSYARGRYGHTNDPWGQARAAYRYYVDSGRDWSPWSCKPRT